MMNDGQVRLLSGVGGEAAFDAVDERMLTRAIDNLQQCAVVGITEQFDGTLLLLQRSFGWNHISYAHANVGYGRMGRGQLDAETIDAVRRYNRHDQALYEETLRLFNRQCRAMGRVFPLRVVKFRSINRLRRYSVRMYLREIQARFA
jgi:hypothetical protein